jgi:glycine/D-amino acid oxidase-like deaminating enzyme
MSEASRAKSLWEASATVPPFGTPTLAGDRRVDVAIIGGGFTGLSAALHGAELGASIAVVEAESVGYGASGRNGGQVNPGVKLDEGGLVARFGEPGRGLYRLGQEAPDFLADLVARRGLRCSFERNGLFRLAHSPKALATVREAAEAMRQSGIAVEDLDKADVERLVGTSRYLGGLYDPRGASVHPLDLVRGMARAVTEAGAAIYGESPARSLRREAGYWRVETPQGALIARKVLVATNAYSDGLIPRLAQSLLAVNSFQIATAPLGELAASIIPAKQTVYDSRRLILYFRKSPDGRLVLGGRASFSSSRRTSGKVEDYSVLETILPEIFPALRGLPIEYCWAGLVGITFDSLPHYHTLADDLHVAVGFNGRGVALSHRLGAWLGRKLAGRPESFEIPAVSISTMPLHKWHEPVLHVGMQLNRLLDAIGR